MPEKSEKSFWKRRRKWIILGGAALAIVAFIGVRTIVKRRGALPEGIVAGNGRLQGKLVDVSAKEPLRVKQVLVDEGAVVKPGQVVAVLDTTTLESQLAEAQMKERTNWGDMLSDPRTPAPTPTSQPGQR